MGSSPVSTKVVFQIFFYVNIEDMKVVEEKKNTNSYFAVWVKNLETNENYGIILNKVSIQLSKEYTHIVANNKVDVQKTLNAKNKDIFEDIKKKNNPSSREIIYRVYNNYFKNLLRKKDKIPLKYENGKIASLPIDFNKWKFFITKINGKNAPYTLLTKNQITFKEDKDDDEESIGEYFKILKN